jgi:HAD superfamily hydrolase (TIGR01459 family)
MTAAPQDVAILAGFGAIAGDYDLALCDIWGVLHAGVAAFRAASQALLRFRQGGGRVILISNAPRPGASVVSQLAELGVPRLAFDAIVTSGDVTRALLDQAPTRPYFWLGPPRDGPLFAGLMPGVATLEEADIIVCTGLDDDTTQTPADYTAILTRARDLKLPFICANPDLIVDRGGQLIYCAGALGQAYEALGGQVIYAGKPDLPIYRAALDKAAAMGLAAIALERIIAIGDALATDIAGAAKLGCASLFIAQGIHARDLREHDQSMQVLPPDREVAPSPSGGLLSKAALQRLLAAGGPRPTFAMERLVW